MLRQHSGKKKAGYLTVVICGALLPLIPMDGIGDLLWSACAIALVIALIIVHWFVD